MNTMRNGCHFRLPLTAAWLSLAVVSVGLADPILIHGGKIYTMDESHPTAEALVIDADTIRYCGALDTARSIAGDSARMINLNGGIAIPGLTDAHAHVNNLGKLLQRVNLIGTQSVQECIDSVVKRVEISEPGEWILGRGWDQNDWETNEFPSWRDLEELGDNPICLTRVDGHAIWVNKTALRVCEIDAETLDPEGGRIIRDATGAPTGILIDNAKSLVEDYIADTSLTERIARIKLALEEINRNGLTGVHDAHIDSLDVAAYRQLYRDGDLTVRIYGILDSQFGEFVDSWFKRGPSNECNGLLAIRAVKGYADGALGSRGAALIEDYSDDPGNRGLMVSSPDSLVNLAKNCYTAGFQFCVHAIGDRGNRETLDAYASAFGADSSGDARFRIEHAQVVALDDIPRFRALGVIPAMQPTHCTSDMYWAEERVGAERIAGAYAWRKFLNAGCRIAFGSDFPVEGVNPLWGIYAAVTRQDQQGWPENGWRPEEKFSITEALRGFTVDAAYASFAESKLGSIRVGTLADITLLDRDIFAIAPSEILETKSIGTIVNGRIVYLSD